jgi:FG-GAP-like repeat
MRTNAFRAAAAAALSIGLVPVVFTQAQAAPAPTPGAPAQAPISKLSSLRADVLRGLGQSSAKSSLAATATGIAAPPTGLIRMSSTCPTGQFPKALSHAGFEAGLPFPDPLLSDGFTVETGPGAPDGTHWAHSSLLANDPVTGHFLTTNHHSVPQTGKVYLSFTYRAASVDGLVGGGVNTDGVFLPAAPEWTSVFLDITSERATAGDGTADVSFLHMTDTATASSLDVDDVNLYTCAIPPISGVRGDWSGQGTVDLMATRADGTLWMYEGTGAGTVGRGVRVGTGWSSFTWQGSPGDVNGDRRTDLMARRSDGTLWLYPGAGNGLLGHGTQVGTGWNTMTAITTPGDFDLDGRPDLVARRADGTLHLYRTLPTGALRYVRQIGAGWNIMGSIVGMGDLSGDRRGDLLAVRTDGTMFSYLSTGTGLAGGRTVSAGWKVMTRLTSPGDMNKDGRGDLIARRSDGTLWFYAGRAGGGVLSGKQVGAGWNIMSNIL